MAIEKTYAALIVAGRKEYINVPLQIKDSVKLVLQEYVVDEVITAEQYEVFVGEPYVG